MIDIRRKREIFHQTIRISQRDSIRDKIRKDMTSQFQGMKQRKDFINLINEPFSFCEDWEHERQFIWTTGANQLDRYLEIPYKFMQEISLAFIDLITQFENDQVAKVELNHHLIENLPFLVPPPHRQLKELPQSFIQLCLYILKDPEIDISDKENFIDSLPHETINRCLLTYFQENWDEIKLNKCADINVELFALLNLFKNLFTKTIYYHSIFQDLLDKSITEILALTRKERQLYDKWNMDFEQLESEQQNVWENENLTDFQSNYYSEEDRLFYVIKNAMFLSNLLLLSPTPNFDIKRAQKNIKTIAFYLYRKILLNEYNSKYQIHTEICVSVLLNFGTDYHLDKEIQILNLLLYREIHRAKLRNFNQKNNQDQDFDIDKVIPTKEENLDGENSFVLDEETDKLLSRINLLLISTMAQNSQAIKFCHIQKWLQYQFKKQKNNIFDLNKPEVIRCLLQLLKKIIQNEVESPQTYKSYTNQKTYINICEEQIFAVKASICKLFRKNGFQQLIDHVNLKHYSVELCDLLCKLMDGLDKIGDISAIVFDFFTVQNYRESDEFQKENFYEDNSQNEDDHNQGKPRSKNPVLSTVKIFIYNMAIMFLDKTYKLLPYKQKEKLMMYLVGSDNMSLEQVKKYTTLQEGKRFQNNVQFCWERYDSDDDPSLGDNEEEENDGQKESIHWNFQDQTEPSYQGYEDVEI